eukprot:474262-Heterocapsa_arctica.AAC.1
MWSSGKVLSVQKSKGKNWKGKGDSALQKGYWDQQAWAMTEPSWGKTNQCENGPPWDLAEQMDCSVLDPLICLLILLS